jgi:hypothetical protein
MVKQTAQFLVLFMMSFSFMAFLMARSKTLFNFNGWNEKERIDFKVDSNNYVTELAFKVNGKLEFTATKIKP